jgi:hypothetical protein
LATTVPSGDSGWNRHFFNSSNQQAPGHPPARPAGKRIAFVELVAPKPAVSPRETRSTAIEVVLPIGYRVRVAGGFERSVLAELLDVLEARR